MILGGVEIPHTLGLLGHSDADVLVHAIMDALLGAAALGDIGKHFPDTDPQYKGFSSMKLLEHVRLLLEKNGYVVENIDATVMAQMPKRRPYIAQMEEEYCIDPWHCKRADQYQGNDRGRTWVYRNGRRNFVTGNLYAERIL